MNQSCGFLYIASGEKYVAEAINSVRSLKSVTPNAHCTLATTDQLPQHIQAEFDNLVLIDHVNEVYSDWAVYLKPEYLYNASPYDLTVFIDTDTYVCENLNPLFSLLKYFDIAVSYSPFHKTISNEEELLFFEEYNSGLIVFRKNDKVKHFVESWRERYESKLNQGNGLKNSTNEEDRKLYKDNFVANQPSFTEELVKSDLRIYTLPDVWNFRSHSPSVVYGSVKVIHYRKHSSEFFSKLMNENSDFFRLWHPYDVDHKIKLLWNPVKSESVDQARTTKNLLKLALDKVGSSTNRLKNS